jgi:hypothetical protein
MMPSRGWAMRCATEVPPEVHWICVLRKWDGFYLPSISVGAPTQRAPCKIQFENGSKNVFIFLESVKLLKSPLMGMRKLSIQLKSPRSRWLASESLETSCLLTPAPSQEPCAHQAQPDAFMPAPTMVGHDVKLRDVDNSADFPQRWEKEKKI